MMQMKKWDWPPKDRQSTTLQDSPEAEVTTAGTSTVAFGVIALENEPTVNSEIHDVSVQTGEVTRDVFQSPVMRGFFLTSKKTD